MKKISYMLALFLSLGLITAYTMVKDQSDKEVPNALEAESDLTEFSSVFFDKADLLQFLDAYSGEKIIFHPLIEENKLNLQISKVPVEKSAAQEMEAFQLQYEVLENPIVGEPKYDGAGWQELTIGVDNMFKSVTFPRKDIEKLLAKPACKGIVFYPAAIDLGNSGTYRGTFKSIKAEVKYKENYAVSPESGPSSNFAIGFSCPPYLDQRLFH